MMKKVLLSMAMMLSLTGILAQDAMFTKPADFFGFEPHL